MFCQPAVFNTGRKAVGFFIGLVHAAAPAATRRSAISIQGASAPHVAWSPKLAALRHASASIEVHSRI